MTSARPVSGLGLYVLLYTLFLYVPVLVLPLFSFNDAIFVAFPLKGFTGRWYGQLLADARLHAALVNSFTIAVAAATVATAAGTLTAYALTRRRSRIAALVTPAALIPLAIPGVVLGIGLLVVANAVGLGPSLAAVLVGHVAVCLPLTIVVMRGRFGSYSATVEEAAADLGASEWQVFRTVSLPIVWPGIVSCLLLSFTTSFDEFIVSYFLVGAQQTLPIFIWSSLRYADQLPKILALGTLVLLGSSALVVAAELVQRRNATGRAAT